MKFSMEKPIKNFALLDFFLPSINASVFSKGLKTKITYLPHWVKNTYTAEAHTQRTIPTMATSLGRTVTGGKPLGWKFKANLESRTRKKKNANQNSKLKLGIETKEKSRGPADLMCDVIRNSLRPFVLSKLWILVTDLSMHWSRDTFLIKLRLYV